MRRQPLRDEPGSVVGHPVRAELPHEQKAPEVQELEPVLPLVQGVVHTRFCDGQGWAS
jgi:hypothetical protein